MKTAKRAAAKQDGEMVRVTATLDAPAVGVIVSAMHRFGMNRSQVIRLALKNLKISQKSRQRTARRNGK